MKTSHQCPKCNSFDVIKVEGYSINAYQKIPLTKWSTKNAILDRYICVDCGYTEEYVQLDPSFAKWARKQLRDQDRSFGDYV